MIDCPMCGGKGKVNPPHLKQKILSEKALAAKKLQSQGYSIREIMKALKYKSPRSVVMLLNKKP